MKSLSVYIDLFIKSSFFQITELSSMKICYKLQDREKIRYAHFLVCYDLLYFYGFNDDNEQYSRRTPTAEFQTNNQASVKFKISFPLSYLEAVSHELRQRGPEQKHSFFKVMSLSQQTDSELPQQLHPEIMHLTWLKDTWFVNRPEYRLS